jgi:hypothetical protein
MVVLLQMHAGHRVEHKIKGQGIYAYVTLAQVRSQSTMRKHSPLLQCACHAGRAISMHLPP